MTLQTVKVADPCPRGWKSSNHDLLDAYLHARRVVWPTTLVQVEMRETTVEKVDLNFLFELQQRVVIC